MRRHLCIRCQSHFTLPLGHRLGKGMCLPCRDAHRAEGFAVLRHVLNAKNRGQIKNAKDHWCVDCGKQAHDWDHRDYLKPLDVQPVCRSCNLKRGPAFDSVYRPQPSDGSVCDVNPRGESAGVVHSSSICPPVPINANQLCREPL